MHKTIASICHQLIPRPANLCTPLQALVLGTTLVDSRAPSSENEDAVLEVLQLELHHIFEIARHLHGSKACGITGPHADGEQRKLFKAKHATAWPASPGVQLPPMVFTATTAREETYCYLQASNTRQPPSTIQHCTRCMDSGLVLLVQKKSDPCTE